MAKAICVLGMHRSGTSLVARVVNLLGAYLGEPDAFMAPGADNPEGYWERRDLYDFHERLLKELNRTWDTAFPLPTDWHLSAPVKPYRRELLQIVDSVFGGQDLWAWKDPRCSLLLPLWRSALEESGVELVCLMTLRNPLDVAKSLSRRNGFSEKESYGIWLNYNLGMLSQTGDVPRALLSYDRLIEDWEDELVRCGKEMGVRWKRLTASLRKSVSNSIRADLRHSATTMEELQATSCPAPVFTLYELMHGADSAERGHLDPQVVDALAVEQATYANLLLHDRLVCESSVAEERGRSRNLEDQLRSLEESKSRTLERLRGEEAESTDLRMRLERRQAQIAELNRLIEATEARVEDVTSLYKQRDEATQRRLADLEQRLEERRAQISSALVERDASVQRLESIRARADELADELRSVEKERRGLEKDLLAARERAEQAGVRLLESRSDLEKTSRRLEDATLELKRTTKELAETSESMELLEEYMLQTDRMHEQALEAMVGRVVELHDQLRQVYGSRSWQLTAPLRIGTKLAGKVRRRISGSGNGHGGQ